MPEHKPPTAEQLKQWREELNLYGDGPFSIQGDLYDSVSGIDMDFIEMSVKTLPLLLDEIERLQTQLALVRQDAEVMAKVFNQEVTDYENVKAVEIAQKYRSQADDQ